MIIFYKKDTCDIFSVIEGRVHNNPEKAEVIVTGIDKNNIGKYIVPYKKLEKEDKEPIYKYRLINTKTLEVEKYIDGYKKIMVYAGSIPDVSFADLILDFETGKKNIYDYKIVIDKANSVIGFELKV